MVTLARGTEAASPPSLGAYEVRNDEGWAGQGVRAANTVLPAAIAVKWTRANCRIGLAQARFSFDERSVVLFDVFYTRTASEPCIRPAKSDVRTGLNYPVYTLES